MTQQPGELQKIPGVGWTIAQDPTEIGIHKIADLQGQNPEDLYEKLCAH